jgi:hypothetical protein
VFGMPFQPLPGIGVFHCLLSGKQGYPDPQNQKNEAKGKITPAKLNHESILQKEY